MRLALEALVERAKETAPGRLKEARSTGKKIRERTNDVYTPGKADA
ncbi:MAG: hypothetical protein ACLR78_04240 [Roseburia sp.]